MKSTLITVLSLFGFTSFAKASVVSFPVVYDIPTTNSSFLETFEMVSNTINGNLMQKTQEVCKNSESSNFTDLTITIVTNWANTLEKALDNQEKTIFMQPPTIHIEATINCFN